MNGRRVKRLRRHLQVAFGKPVPPAAFKKAMKSLKRAAARGQPQPAAKATPERVHKPKKAIKPTWPHSLDQERQSRPIYVLHPNRAPSKEAREERRKSAVSKRLDHPARVAAMDRGSLKIFAFLGRAAVILATDPRKEE